MALSDHDLAPARKGPSCSVGVLISRIPADDQATLSEWFADEDKFATSIADALNAEFGVSLSAFVVNRHRRNRCAC